MKFNYFHYPITPSREKIVAVLTCGHLICLNKDNKDYEYMIDKSASSSRVINSMKSGLIEAIEIAPCYFNKEGINYELACLIIHYSVTLIEAERHISNCSFSKNIIREVGGGEKIENL